MESNQKKLKDLSHELGIENIVKFTGHLPYDEVKSLLKDIKIQVVPSRFQEPFGMTALEGMAMGCFTISSDRGGLVEFLEDRKNSLIFESNNHSDLSKKITEAICNYEMYSSCVEEGYKTAEVFSWENAASKIEKIYDKLLSSNKKYLSNRIR